MKNKKSKVNKTKLKKTIRNILCRPDPVFWPVPTQCEEKLLVEALEKYKIDIPEFIKPHWKELKLIPKGQRPKLPRTKKVDGLLFGISQCHNAVKNKQCTAVIIASEVNPRSIIQPLIDTCSSNKIPVTCLSNLRKICTAIFGIATSALCIKCGYLPELSEKLLQIAKVPPCTETIITPIVNENSEKANDITMDIDNQSDSMYLYRKSKKSRVFIPSGDRPEKAPKALNGESFISIDTTSNIPNNTYMRMILKKISNNANRGNNVNRKEGKQT